MTEVTVRAPGRPNTTAMGSKPRQLYASLDRALAAHLALSRRLFHRLPYDHRPFARRGRALEQRAGARQGVALSRLDRNLEPVALHVQRCLVDHQVGTWQACFEVGDARERGFFA